MPEEVSVQIESTKLHVETVAWHGAIDPGVLSHEERARLATFASAERRRHFALGRLAARHVVGACWGRAPEAVALVVDAGGAVTLESGHVSIAHGGRGFEAVGVAAYADRPVGVDVEAVGPRHPGLARRIVRPDEAGLLDALGGPGDDSVTLVWALKEAVLKGQRTGLRAGARSVRLAVDGPGGVVEAWSDRSGPWRVAFRRRGGLWMTVATSVSPDPQSGLPVAAGATSGGR